MSYVERVARGFATVEVPDEVRAAALAGVERWLREPAFATFVPVIRSWIEREQWVELLDAFYQVVPFGTGGRRGLVGVGPNRMNPWTVGTSVQGHAAWLRRRVGPGVRPSVVVAYDVRRFTDAGGRYDRSVDNPVFGWSSRDFAELAAGVYAANDVDVHILPRGASYYLSTPELSFSVRALRADGGLNVSASHNPPDDNGVKVYDHRGGQLVPPDDQELLDEVGRWSEATALAWDAALSTGRVHLLAPALHQAYIDAVAAVVPPGPRRIRVGYTPLHGTGCVGDVLTRAGFVCALHEPQATPDGSVPTVPGQVANPERPEAMAHALAALDVDLVFGTDPDADRIGCEVRHQGGWVHLTGNDIGALVVHRRLRDAGDRQALVITTEVTSSLVGAVARAGGAAVVDDLLVGFKYVADVLRALDEEGSYGPLHADAVRYVAGLEESHGVLVTDQMRDKDAAGGAVVLAALADEAAARGETLVDVLRGLEFAHGYVACAQLNLQFPGATGANQMRGLLDRMRASPPATLGGRPVEAFIDHWDQRGRFGPFRSASDRAGRNVLVARLGAGAVDRGARVILRPSGTEPKLKVYLEVAGAVGLAEAGRAEVREALAALGAAVRADVLR